MKSKTVTHSRLLAVAALAGVVALAAATLALTRGSPAFGPLKLGLSSAYSLPAIRAQQPYIGWLREDISWAQVELRPGRWDWGSSDAVFADAARNGFTVLPLLMDAPGWAAPTFNTIPSDPGPYADYVAHVVTRYGPDGDFWRAHPELPSRPATYFEVWNEPYLLRFSQGGADPARYARLFRAASAAGHAATARAKFLIAADTTGQTARYGYWVPWVDALYKAVPDLNRYIDGVAVHPYADASPPDRYTPGNGDRWQVGRIEQIHASFAAHGAGDRPFWLTEIGWSTCAADAGHCVSEAQQAENVRRVVELARSRWSDFVAAVFVYRYRDTAPTDPADSEQWYGLVRPDGSPKPAWAALRAVSRR